MASSFLTKTELVAIIRLQDRNVTEDDIPDEFMDLWVDTKVRAQMFEFDIFPSDALAVLNSATDERATDIKALLKLEAVAWALDGLMAMHFRGLTWSPIVLSRQDIGRISEEFQRTMPMFFFARGIERGFFALLASDTPRMQGFMYSRLFADAYHRWSSAGAFVGIPWHTLQPDSEPSKKTAEGNWRTNW